MKNKLRAFALATGLTFVLVPLTQAHTKDGLQKPRKPDGSVPVAVNTGEAKNYCAGNTDSLGQSATIGYQGSLDVTQSDFQLTVSNARSYESGMFIAGPQAAKIPFGGGTLCVSGGSTGLIRMHPVTPADSRGNAAHRVDLKSGHGESGKVRMAPGSTWYFQFWGRDSKSVGGGALSDALKVTFAG